MKRIFVLGLTAASLFSAKGPRANPRVFERAMHAMTDHMGWLDLVGGWDGEGNPYLMYVNYQNRWDADLMHRDFRYKDRINLTGESGKVYPGGISIQVSNEDGKNRTWSAYVPHYEPYKSYQVIPRGTTEKTQGLLEPPFKAPPVLTISETKGTFTWQVTNARTVWVDVSVNDGETWDALGDKPKGTADLNSRHSGFPVVRIKAFQGLHAFVDFYLPGQGIVEDGWPYLQQTYFQLPFPPRSSSVQFSANPKLWFGPMGGLPADFTARIKFTMDYRRLPFDPKAVFPGQFIQKVFQAEWKYRSTTPIEFGIDERLLNDRTRTSNLRLMRVSQNPEGVWKPELVFTMGMPQYADPKAQKYVDYNGMDPVAARRDPVVTFKDYWVIASD